MSSCYPNHETGMVLNDYAVSRDWAHLACPLSAARRQLVVAEDEGVGGCHAHQRGHHKALQQHPRSCTLSLQIVRWNDHQVVVARG